MRVKIKLKLLCSFLAVNLVFFYAAPQPAAHANVIIPITAPSAVLLDATAQRLVYSKTPHLRRAPASTTKILTAIVAVEELPLDKVITIPAFVSSIEPSKVHLAPGERYYVRDLIKATLINSANDAAETLAWAAAGSRTQFADLMNAKAKALGCTRSHFVRGSGLPARGQYSTALDMARIMREAYRYPFLVQTFKTRTTSIQSLDGRVIPLKNHNKMLWQGQREVVGKTGWTRTARHCFVGHINAAGRSVFVSMLGSHRLWRDLKTLVDYEFGLSLYKIQNNRKTWSRLETDKIQTALQKAGYNPGGIDGQFGIQTLKAVKAFQRANGLKADGVVGGLTWKKLQSYL